MKALTLGAAFITALLLGAPKWSGAQIQETTIRINQDIELIKIKDSFFVHTSWYAFPGSGRFPSNGLIFAKNGQAILIDTPNDNEQTEQMCDYLTNIMGIRIEKVIVGHYHSDCLGGLGYLQKQGIESVSSDLTRRKCEEKDLPVPSRTFHEKLILDFEGEKVICRYFGGGHTMDNIVVYFPSHKILFGGCLVRALNAEGLGYTKEAVIEKWDKTIKKIQEEFPDIEVVIPGHGRFGGPELLRHTIELVEKARN